MKLIALSGSLAPHALNTRLLKEIQRLYSRQLEIEIADISMLPMFSENIPDPSSIKVLSQQIANADGVILATPEYAHSVSASLKSALEWLSYRVHPFDHKPVMIVGASTYPQGTSRAQLHLRQILDSPGLNALVLPGNEFLLGDAQTAFDANDQIKAQPTITFLKQCVTNFIDFINQSTRTIELQEENAMKQPITHWDATYDVVVLGFGGAGATAARFAADAGAKVLIVDAAPKGHEGGNTRYAEQFIACGDDPEALKDYLQALSAPLTMDSELLDTFVEGLVGMEDYLKTYLKGTPARIKKTAHPDPNMKPMAEEYPEYPGATEFYVATIHPGFGDSGLWRALRQAVIDRSDQIDVMYQTPARHLIQSPTKQVIGVQIEREHVLRNIKANNGVILATGGFENNQQMIQDYLGEAYLSPIGSLYNRGAGVAMAQEAGAGLSHMHAYESMGMMHGLVFKAPAGRHGKGSLAMLFPQLSTGSIFVVGDDGTRYFREDEMNRHGHIYLHGTWRVPQAQTKPYLIFDQSKYDEFVNIGFDGLPDMLKAILPRELVELVPTLAISAPSLKALAKRITVSSEQLENTVAEFNTFADQGVDYAYHRAPQTLRRFDEGPYYAIALQQGILNTQGGAKRNSRSEVLRPDGSVIANLYECGELGAPFVNQYVGGCNLAELLIFGKIAGENAAVVKSPAAEKTASSKTVSPTIKTDSDETEKFETAANQYLGMSDAGMGGKVVVRITVDDQGDLQNVEILQQAESDDVAGAALAALPAAMIKHNTYQVDAVSGASRSSKAIKDAVKNALDQVKTRSAVDD